MAALKKLLILLPNDLLFAFFSLYCVPDEYKVVNNYTHTGSSSVVINFITSTTTTTTR